MGRLLPVALLCAAALGCGVSHDLPADGGADAGTDASSVARDAAAPAPDAGSLDGGSVVLPARWFEDVTAAALDWERTPAEGMRTFADRFSGGVCVLDADGRAPVDLFFTARGAGRSRLFVGAAPMRFEDRTEALGLADVGDAIGCLAFDAEGDGDDDLLVTLVGGVELFLRDGAGFVRAGDLGADLHPDGMYASAAAGDVDGDGDLDLLIAGFMARDPSLDPTLECFAHLPCTADIHRHVAIPNALLLREGGGYVDGTSLAPALALGEPTLVVAIGDFLEEGAPSLYVGNDLGARFFDRVLRRLPDGTFADVALDAGFATNWRGYGIDTMGLSSGDPDRDGRLEHAVTSFETDATALFDCYSPAVCEDRSEAVGTRSSEETFRWGAAFLDVDLDGWMDLVEATGHYFLPLEIEAIGYRGGYRQPPNLLHNRGDGTLARVAPAEDDGLSRAHAARGIARTDLDDDGRPDLVLATAEGAPAILHNVRSPEGRWLVVTLEGAPPNTRAIGAMVRVDLDRGALALEQRAGEGYLGSFDRRLFFGLGPAVERVDVTVRWPSGTETRVRGAAVDRVLVIREAP